MTFGEIRVARQTGCRSIPPMQSGEQSWVYSRWQLTLDANLLYLKSTPHRHDKTCEIDSCLLKSLLLVREVGVDPTEADFADTCLH